MIAGVRVFELNFKSKQAVVIAGQNLVPVPSPATKCFSGSSKEIVV
jgi:hypothetical protein